MTFDSGSCEEFIIILNSIGKIEKIRIGVEEAEDDFEWSVEKVSNLLNIIGSSEF